MRISTFFYTIRQGFRNIFRNKLFSLASIATITACLFLFGVFYAIVLNLQNMVKTAEEGVSVTVFFEEDTDDATIEIIGQRILERVEVAKVVFVSADEAWESFREEYLGEYADGFTENPLEGSANYEVYLSDVSLQSDLVTYLQSIPEVRKINQSQSTADMLTGFNSLLGYISAGIILILFGVSIFLISNTVTIGINVRKEEISIMKYIGATDFFVRCPFVVEGMIIGLVGAAIPLVIIYFLYNEVVTYVLSRFSILTSLLVFLPIEEVFTVLLPLSLAIGVGIGFIGSFTTVRKHLKV
ncbi:MAG: ABC transporter permease [Lachnospiraceae bacterium]|nr:ABC transporter permease [Lachnospiraceae bacterium]MBR3769360.1 permease-like cell division protein FtsX [Lachnospiraceae bacterium]